MKDFKKSGRVYAHITYQLQLHIIKFTSNDD